MNSSPGENRIRLVLVDEHGLSRVSLARLLAAEAGLEVAAECGGCGEAIEALAASVVHIVLLDLNIGLNAAGELVRASRVAGYRGEFVLMAGDAGLHSSALALKFEAAGFFLKSEGPERLVQAVRLVAGGAMWIDRKVIHLLAARCCGEPAPQNDGKPQRDLSERERNVIAGVLGGLTNRKIADGMGMTEGSVKGILQVLFARTGVRSRSQLVRLALEGGLERRLVLPDGSVVPDAAG